MVEVGADGETAKGIWIMAGLESGLMDPEVAKNVPEWVFSGGEVDGKPVWAHWVWCKYGVDFIKQDGEWRIWHFRCYEVARAPFNRDWISFAKDNQESHDSQLAWFGDDGVPVFLPPVDEPVTTTNYYPYANDKAQVLDPEPPLPYDEVRGHVPLMAADSRRDGAGRGARIAAAGCGAGGRVRGPVRLRPGRRPSSTSRCRRCRTASGSRPPACSGW